MAKHDHTGAAELGLHLLVLRCQTGDERAFRTWLFRMTRNRAIDFLRTEKREAEWIAHTSLDALGAQGPATAPDDPTPTDEMLDAMDALAPAHREVCLLRYRDDLSYAEI